MDNKNKEMAQAAYKSITSDYRHITLMTAIGIALSSWRENYKSDSTAEGAQPLTITAVAKVIGERYESVYRIENAGGTIATLVKYLLFIKHRDPSFDLDARLREIMGDKYPKY